MMKRKSILLALFTLVTMGSKAYDFSVDGIYYNITDKNGKVVEVTSGDTKYSGSVTIPATVSNDGTTYTVAKIGTRAFKQCTNLESVTLGSKVETIGLEAFCYCNSLSKINLNDQIVTFESSAFSGCTSLTSVVIGNKVDKMESNVFYGCINIKTVDIHDGASVIGDCAFEGCEKLTTITIPNSVLSIGSAAFYDCVSLTEAKVGNGVQKIPTRAFKNCSRLKTVSLGSGVKEVGLEAFYYCNSMTSFTVLNPDPPTVDQSAFSDYSATLYVPSQSASAYKSHEIWKKFGAIKNYEDKVYLTIRHANNGSVKQLINVGETYRFDIQPASGWSVHSVTYNNVDVTGQMVGNSYTTPAITSNATLSIVFSEGGSGVRSAFDDDVKVSSDTNGNIIIRDAPSGETIYVYSTNGTLLKQITADGGHTSITMNTHGIYIVKVGSLTAKLSL